MSNRILIITGDTADARVLQNALNEAKDNRFIIERLTKLSDGLKRIRKGGVDAIMANLSLSDSQGIKTFDKLFTVAPHTPIMVLSALDDEMLTTEAVQSGAQGYLTKGNFESYLLSQSLHNMIQRKAIEETFFIEKARAEITLNSISDAVISTDVSGNVDYLNTAAETMTGWSREEAQGHPISEVMQIINGVTRKPESNPVYFILQQNKSKALAAGTILIRRDGNEAAIEDSAAPIHDWDGKLAGAVIVFHDITASQVMILKMAHLAQHDFLTDLPNRMLLSDRIAQSIALAKRQGTQLAVLYLDLDNFKHINDSLGHLVGDKLLQSVAQSLQACVRSSDTVSRQGGDEFIVLVTENKYVEHTANTANRILTVLSAPYSIGEQDIHVTTSIGISVYPEDGQDSETLIKKADTAMYHAKEKGRNNYQFFKSEMNVRAVERQFIEVQLRRALDQQIFILHYQPKVNLDTGVITGVEALLRMIEPGSGMVLPDRFVSIAEDCGLIVPIGQWVLREACSQTMRWKRAGLKTVPVAVNISALELRQKDFVKDVLVILKETGLEADCLQLEITEDVLMSDTESNIETLRQFKKMGVQLTVDNFGTGYSSLSYLNKFPIDILKIDRSFVHDIGSINDNGAIAGAIIAMGISLKQQVVAEGVEERAQLTFLKERNCEEGQGFFFSHPLFAEQFAVLLTTGISETCCR
ncbi:MAG: EAL domain-containing protein [Candidatus Electrothrix sp. GW3-4]|uniref:EAL domain-containing protein n=1 Tax=Candidatus Electrothrix sp. GW3-4 TaxID=3126740 RepID=UPI0030CEFA0A